MFITIIIFIAILAVLVLSHEFGHFIVAKKFGMRVDEFGFGFPPKIFGIKKGETIYSFNLLLIGGFVKIFGENPLSVEDDTDSSRVFYKQKAWKRALVLCAGVSMNFFTAYILFVAINIVGVPTVVSDDYSAQNLKNISVQIVDVAKNSPAEQAGIKTGDVIEKLNIGTSLVEVKNVADVQNFISENKGKELVFTINRGQEILDLNLKVREVFPEGEGATGIALMRVGTLNYPWYKAIGEGVKTFWIVFTGTLVAFGGMIKSLVFSGSLPSDISGPVGIAYMTGAVRSLGFVYLLQFIALISLNLGIINLIPFPALDGGRLLFLIIEKLKGSPVPKKVEGVAHTIGFVLLILLIIAATFHDINKFF